MAPRPNDSPDVRASKTLAYILRHGAEKEGLHIRSDGLVRLVDVLARPKCKELDQATVFRLVEENAKKRFELVFGYDPSPPKPKVRKSGKGPKKQPKKIKTEEGLGASDDIDRLGDKLASTNVTEATPAPVDTPTKPVEPEWKELDFVTIPVTDNDTGPSDPRAEWFIRATQGHSLKLEGTGHLEAVTLDDQAARDKAGLMVHGTRWELWETLKANGLSKMNRQHVHLAPALEGHRITPRVGSTLLIYLDLDKMLTATPPIPVLTAANGVVLSPGNEEGCVPKEFWKKAVHVAKGQHITVWENGQEVIIEAAAAAGDQETQ